MALLCLALRPLLASWLALDGPAFTSLFQGATRWQTFIALAVAGSLFGEFGLALASVAAVAMIPILNVISVWVLARYAAPTPPTLARRAAGDGEEPVHLVLRHRHCAQPAACPDSRRRCTLSPMRSAARRWRSGFCWSAPDLQVAALMRPSAATWITSVLKLVVMPAFAISLGTLLGATGTPLA